MKKNKKNNSRMTLKEAYDYYFKKHPFLLIWIILFMVLITMCIASWDGTIPRIVPMGKVYYTK